jgi:glycosyltransferase involved in cell wall biosynthesis
LLIVDDGSHDGTAVVADALAAELPGTRVIHHPENRGLGGVYRTGLCEARGELVSFFPADGQFPAAILEEFAPLMASLDMVLGYLPQRDGPLLARFLSWGERLLYRLLFGRFPRFQGIFMLRRARLGDFELQSSGRGWAIVMELIIRGARAGWRMRSVPTGFRPRRSGLSKVQNGRTVWSNLEQTLALRRYL